MKISTRKLLTGLAEQKSTAVVYGKKSLQCSDAVGWAAGRASGP